MPKPEYTPARWSWTSFLSLAGIYIVLDVAIRSAAGAGRLLVGQTLTASAAALVLRTARIPAVASGASVNAGTSTVNVTGFCMPSAALALSVALMLGATGFAWHRRIVWALLGVVAVLAVNVGRIAVVGWLAWQRSPALQVVHVNVAPVFLVFTGFLVWLVALRWERLHG